MARKATNRFGEEFDVLELGNPRTSEEIEDAWQRFNASESLVVELDHEDRSRLDIERVLKARYAEIADNDRPTFTRLKADSNYNEAIPIAQKQVARLAIAHEITQEPSGRGPYKYDLERAYTQISGLEKGKRHADTVFSDTAIDLGHPQNARTLNEAWLKAKWGDGEDYVIGGDAYPRSKALRELESTWNLMGITGDIGNLSINSAPTIEYVGWSGPIVATDQPASATPVKMIEAQRDFRRQEQHFEDDRRSVEELAAMVEEARPVQSPTPRPLSLGSPVTTEELSAAWTKLTASDARTVILDRKRVHRDMASAILQLRSSNAPRSGEFIDSPPTSPLVVDVNAAQEKQIAAETAMIERRKAIIEEKPVVPAEEGITEGAIPGAKRKRYGVGSNTFDTRYYILDANQVIQSHDPRTGNPNPLYAHGESLQPRDRKDTVAWVYGTALDLQPLPLIDSRGLGGGPPIIDPRGMVLDGNGRVMAFKLAETMPGRMEAYREALAEEGPLLGFSDEDIDRAMKLPNPMIVSRVLNKADIPEIVRQGNQPRTAALTVQEQSQQDASQFDPALLNELEIGPSDDTFDDILKKSQNQKPLREMLGDMTTGNIGGLFDETGRITAAGRQRLTKAAMTFAMGTSEPANRVLKTWLNQDESEAIGRLKTGVERSLLDLVKLRTSIASGDLGGEFDIADDLAKVIESYPAARKYKDRMASAPYDIDSYFTASGFGPTSVSALNENQRSLLRKFHAISRSPISVATLLGNYVRHASGNAVPQGQGAMIDLSEFSEAQDPRTALIKAEEGLTATGRTSETFIKDALEHGRLTGLSSGDTTSTEKALGQLAGVQTANPEFEGEKIEPTQTAAPQVAPVANPKPATDYINPATPKVVQQPVTQSKPVVSEPQPDSSRTNETQLAAERPEDYFIGRMAMQARYTEEKTKLPVPSSAYIEKLAKAAVEYDRRKEFDAHMEANPWLSVSTAPDLSEVVQRPRYAEEHDEMPDLEEYRGWARRRANLANTRGLKMADAEALDRLAGLAEQIRSEHKRPYSESREAWMQDVPMTPESIVQLEKAINEQGMSWGVERKARAKSSQRSNNEELAANASQSTVAAETPAIEARTDSQPKPESRPKSKPSPPNETPDLRAAITQVNQSIWKVRDDLKGDADQTRMMTRTGSEPDASDVERERAAMEELEMAGTPSMFNDPDTQLRDLYVSKVREYAALEAELEVKGRHKSEATENAHKELEAYHQRINNMPLPRVQPARKASPSKRRGGGGGLMSDFLPKGVTMEQAGYGKRR